MRLLLLLLLIPIGLEIPDTIKFENYNSFFEEPNLKEPSFQEIMKHKQTSH